MTLSLVKGFDWEFDKFVNGLWWESGRKNCKFCGEKIIPYEGPGSGWTHISMTLRRRPENDNYDHVPDHGAVPGPERGPHMRSPQIPYFRTRWRFRGRFESFHTGEMMLEWYCPLVGSNREQVYVVSEKDFWKRVG